MNEPFKEIWSAAEPYMRARKNDVHVPISFRYAERILEHHPEANRQVVLLAILLHDIGWATISEEDILSKGFGKGEAKQQIRRLHETEGARLAKDILEAHKVDANIIQEVLDIIDGHDTRLEALSLNDSLVKDADKLWRFSIAGIGIACDFHKQTPREYADTLERKILPALFNEASKRLATDVLRASRTELYLDLLT